MFRCVGADTQGTLDGQVAVAPANDNQPIGLPLGQLLREGKASVAIGARRSVRHVAALFPHEILDAHARAQSDDQSLRHTAAGGLVHDLA